MMKCIVMIGLCLSFTKLVMNTVESLVADIVLSRHGEVNRPRVWRT